MKEEKSISENQKEKFLKRKYIGYLLKNTFGQELCEEIEYMEFEDFVKSCPEYSNML